MQRAYLAGPIAGLTYSQVNGWRDQAWALLKYAGWEAIAPIVYYTDRDYPALADDYVINPGGVFEHDLAAIRRADALLVGYPTGPMKSDGTAFEVGYAFHLGIPIAVWVADGHWDNRLHAFIELAADVETRNLSTAVSTLVACERVGAIAPSTTGGVKNDSGKVPMGLLPRLPLEQVAAILAHGEAKYGRHNWRQGIAVQRNIDAALRHIFAANEGEDLDSDSGLPHFAHAICDLMFVMETLQARPDLDDRYKPFHLRSA